MVNFAVPFLFVLSIALLLLSAWALRMATRARLRADAQHQADALQLDAVRRELQAERIRHSETRQQFQRDAAELAAIRAARGLLDRAADRPLRDRVH